MTAATKPRFIRADGPDKVTGSGRYTADLTLTGMLAAKFRYADIAHARITKLDVTAARAIPGVMAVLTADDVPDVRFGPFVQDRTLFARDVVRFEGEVVAAVAATTAAIAQQAVDAIVVEYEPLPVVTDLEAALAADAPLVHADWASYGAADALVRDRNDASFSSITKGDVEAGLAEADHVITSRYVADGSHAAPIEPRAVVAQWEGNKVTIWTSTQVPFDARAGVCETLDLPANRVRIIVPHLGGGFGGKCGFHYEAHIAALAKAAKRPVRLVFSRREEFLAPDRRREGMVIDITTGVRNDGTITARKAWIAIDNGAYTADSGFFPQLAAMHVSGPYRIPNLYVEGPSRVHQPPAVGLGPGANGAAVVLGDRVAHRRGRGRSGDGSGRLPPPQRRRHRRRGTERADLRRDRCAAVHRGGHQAWSATGGPCPTTRPSAWRSVGGRASRCRRARTSRSTATVRARSSPVPRNAAPVR